MAKTRRASSARNTARKPARKAQSTARKRSAGRSTSRKQSRKALPKRRTTRSSPAPKAAPKAVARPAPAAAPQEPAPAPPRKPTYHEAVSLYERGLQALQRRDFAAAAEALRNVIARYPEERELLERARLYLKVCERELEPREQTPKTADEWVYAATVALNSADEAAALHHLTRALEANPRHDHAHYMMAVASARRGDPGRALEHLRHALSLNPENRSLARQDTDLDVLRDLPAYRGVIESNASSSLVDARPPAAVKSRKVRR